MAASMASVLLAAGAKGKRYALPNSRIMIHQGSAGFRGNTPDVEIQVREYLTSARGRSYLRMTLRNRKLVDTLVERALGTDASQGEAPDAAPEPATTEPTEPTESSEQPEESN
jgi:hypothetical protein